MDLVIPQEELALALGSIQSVVERRSTNQALKLALLVARDDGLQVTGTDSETTVVVRHAARVERNGSVAVDAAHLYQVVRSLPQEPVHLRADELHRLHLEAGPASFTLRGTDPEEFPPTPPFEPTAVLRLRAGDLSRMIAQTVFAIPNDDTRYGINGGHLESIPAEEGEEGPRLRLVTTDGSRLCYAEAPYVGDFGMAQRMLLPRKALHECRKLLEQPDEEVEVAFGERAASFSAGPVILHTRLVDGEFPPYRKVLPSSWKRRLRVERLPFLAALKRVSLEAQDRAHTVRMELEEGGIQLYADSSDLGEARHPVPGELEGEPLVLGFNASFFIELLGALDDEALVLEFGEALSPCVIRPEGRDDALFVIMPIRL